jgi:DNA invertase Pin-like site-specific DNA recombinase
MPVTRLIPAAQYVRMSTDHQKYSIEGQCTTIREYASQHGFDLIATYSDSAKSGVTLKNRPALKKLLSDVVGPTPAFEAILVYDISRFGRFQDTDEPAHYEFLCKSAGIAIHYCAEPFPNDGSLASLIMKSLKRAMAGEYSRELGVKIRAGQRRCARRGFKQGGLAGYGLRRMLVSGDGTTKQILKVGERKNIITDRVLLVPGLPEEIQCVQSIFHMLVSGRRTVREIVVELNVRGIKKVSGKDWVYQDVNNILHHPKYAGFGVFGRTTQRLYTGTIKVPRSEWIMTAGAVEPIVDLAMFLKAQNILWTRTCHVTNAQILDRLRILLAQKGRLSLPLIQECESLPGPTTIIKRFGNLRIAYGLIGYGHGQFGSIDRRQRIHALREELLAKITELSSDKIKVVQRTTRHRAILELPTKQTASVLVGRSVAVWKGTYRWDMDPVPNERHLPTLVALLNQKNEGFEHFYVLPKITSRTRLRMKVDDPLLTSGVEVQDLSRLCDAFAKVSGRQRVRISTHKKYGKYE